MEDLLEILPLAIFAILYLFGRSASKDQRRKESDTVRERRKSRSRSLEERLTDALSGRRVDLQEHPSTGSPDVTEVSSTGFLDTEEAPRDIKFESFSSGSIQVKPIETRSLAVALDRPGQVRPKTRYPLVEDEDESEEFGAFRLAHGLHYGQAGSVVRTEEIDESHPSMRLDSDDARRGIILSEILGPPLALRRGRRKQI